MRTIADFGSTVPLERKIW